METCSKIQFTKREAQERLNIHLREGNFKTGRIYPCNICIGFWHLTHRPKSGKENRQVKEIELVHEEEFKKLIDK